jgi:integrase
MAHTRDKKPPTPLKPTGVIHASDEPYIEEVADAYQRKPSPITEIKHVIDYLRQQANSQYLDGKAPLTQSEVPTVVDHQFTLAQWLKRWLQRYTDRTFDGYESICRVHIIPVLGDIQLRELTKARIQTFMDSIKRSQITKSHIRATLHKALEDAVDEELLERNPCARVHAPLNYTSSKINPLTTDELEVLLSATSIPYYPLIATVVTTGMRQGESLALLWQNVDLERANLRVTQSLEKRRGVTRVKEVKTRQNRRIDLFQFTVGVLTQHREKAYRGADGLVFCKDGSFLDGDAVTRSFQRSLKVLGLRQIRFHDLRHTHATQLLMAGVPVKVVQERLGHESAKMTLDLYGHFVPGLQQKFIAELDISGLPQETADTLAASGQIRTDDRRFTKPLLYP